jgi:hypothetical protein
MSGRGDDSFSERRDAALKAKQALLEKFRARPKADDPAVLERQAERLATGAAREKRAAERKVAREEAAARAVAERAAHEAEVKARAIALEAEQKAKRDARYAKRKAR